MDPAATFVFAHQGGWDEIALVLGPLVVLAALLALANHRAKRSNRRSEVD